VIALAQGPQATPVALTWDYAIRWPHSIFANDLALCTCAAGHTCRLSAIVHRVAKDGTVHPSYVCPVPKCSFHDYVQLEGWNPDHTYETSTKPAWGVPTAKAP